MKNNKKKFIIIFLIVIVIAFISGFIVSKYIIPKCRDNSCTINAINAANDLKKSENANYIVDTQMRLGKYSINKITNEDVKYIGENYYQDIGFEFKKNNEVYIIDIEGLYANGTYKTDKDKIICNITEVYVLDHENGGEKQIETNSEIILQIVNNNTLKVYEVNIDEQYPFNSHIIQNEYVYENLKND